MVNQHDYGWQLAMAQGITHQEDLWDQTIPEQDTLTTHFRPEENRPWNFNGPKKNSQNLEKTQ